MAQQTEKKISKVNDSLEDIAEYEDIISKKMKEMNQFVAKLQDNKKVMKDLIEDQRRKETLLGVVEEKIKKDLNDNWAVVAEAIQTILRREGFPNPYEALKELTRTNATINQEAIHQFIDSLEIEDRIKIQLKTITPFNYNGI